MLTTYWQLSNRILDEEHCDGYAGQPFMHSHTHHHHQYSHHHYPINYSRSTPENGFNDLEKGSLPSEPHGKIRTPQPKRPAKNVFDNQVITVTKADAGKLSTTYTLVNHNKHQQHDTCSPSNSSSVVLVDYKSLQISPLDFCALQRDAKNIY